MKNLHKKYFPVKWKDLHKRKSGWSASFWGAVRHKSCCDQVDWVPGNDDGDDDDGYSDDDDRHHDDDDDTYLPASWESNWYGGK